MMWRNWNWWNCITFLTESRSLETFFRSRKCDILIIHRSQREREEEVRVDDLAHKEQDFDASDWGSSPATQVLLDLG